MTHVTSLVRRSLIATSLGFALIAAGCGDATDEAGLQPPEPVHVVPGGGNTAGLEADGATAAVPRAAADTTMIAPWYVTTYVLGDSLPALPTEATGWHYAAGARPAEDRIATIADALDVDGDLQQVPADQGGGWRIGPDDGTSAALYVSSDGQLSWWYAPAWADARGVVTGGCAVAEPAPDAPDAVLPTDEASAEGDSAGGDTAVEEPDSGDGETPAVEELPDGCEWEEPTPPAGVPEASEAERRARELLTAFGESPDALRFETWADEWSAGVTASVVLDGVVAPVTFSFGFGGEGRLEWAAGVLADPVAVGPYPLVSADDALRRLQDGFGGWGGPMVMRGEDLAADGPAIAIDPPVCDPETPDCTFPEPEEVTVTLVDVEAGLWWAWDADGSVWLLPAYTFVGDDGGRYTVPAVTDDYLIVEEPVAVDDGAVDDGAVEPDTGTGSSDAGSAGTVEPAEREGAAVEPDSGPQG